MDRAVAHAAGAALGLLVLAWVALGGVGVAMLGAIAAMAATGPDGAAIGACAGAAPGLLAFGAIAAALGNVHRGRDGAWRVGVVAALPLVAALGTGSSLTLSPVPASVDGPVAALLALLTTAALAGAALLAWRDAVEEAPAPGKEPPCPPS